MKVFRIFVASPSDLRSERALVKRVVAELNNSPEYRDRAKFIPYLYEDSTPAVIGLEPQAIVDDFMLRSEEADIVVCMFWNRHGTPVDAIDQETGHCYASGTEYELVKAYRHFRTHGTPLVLLYRCTRDANLDEAAAAEARRVDTLFDRFSRAGDLQGLSGTFRSADDFQWTLRTHLLQVIERKDSGDRAIRLRAMFADHGAFIADRVSRFVGRKAELDTVRALISAKSKLGGYITITGQAGQGKSSLIAQLVEAAGRDSTPHHFIPINPGPDHQVNLLRNLMARLIYKYDLSEIYLASDSRPLLRDFFPQVLTEISRRGGQEVILIDGLDQLQEELSGDRDLSFLPLRLPPGIVCVLGTRPNDALKPLELLDPHHEYQLPPLSRGDFQAILDRRSVRIDKATADRFYTAMNANALYLDLIAKELAESESTDPQIIIQRVTDNPDHIFTITLDRLRRQRGLWDAAVKPLLGLLLVVQEPLHDRTIRHLLHLDADTLQAALVRLGGLIARDAAGRYYLFHLKFRDYLRAHDGLAATVHLFDVDEERHSHELLARWCAEDSGDLAAIWLDSADPTERDRRLYAREHLVTHLYFAHRWLDILTLLDNGAFGKAKLRYDPSTRSYGRDLHLGCRALLESAADDAQRLRSLPTVWRFSLLRASLATKARNYPDQLLSLLVLKGRGSEALELIDLMPTAERKIAALCRVAEATFHESGARGSADSILLRAEELADGVRDLWAHARAYRRLLAALLVEREWDQASRIAFKFGDGRERVEALGRLAQALAAAGEATRMRTAIHDYVQLARRIGYQGAMEQTFAAEMTRGSNALSPGDVVFEPTGAAPMTFAFHASVLIGLGRIDEAAAISDCLSDAMLQATTLIAIARHFVRVGDRVSARPIVNSLPDICDRIADAESRTDAIIATSLLLAQVGERSRAIEWLSTNGRAGADGSPSSILDDRSTRVAALVAFVEDVAALGDVDAAVVIVQAAVNIARQDPNLEQRRASLKIIGDVASRIGCHDLAGQVLVDAGGAPLALFGDIDAVLETLQRYGKIKDVIDLMVSDRYLDNLLAKRDWPGAIAFARSEPSKREMYDATAGPSEMGEGQGGLAQTAAAQQRKEQLYFQKRVSRSLVVVRALLKSGERTLAQVVFDETMPLLPRIEDVAVRASASASFAEAVAQLGQNSRVIELANHAFSLSQRLGFDDQLEVLITLVPAALQTQRVALARSILERLTTLAADAANPDAQRLALRYLVRALSRTGATSRLGEVLTAQWMSADSRERVVGLLPIASAIVVADQSAGSYLASSFEWVDDFLSIT